MAPYFSRSAHQIRRGFVLGREGIGPGGSIRGIAPVVAPESLVSLAGLSACHRKTSTSYDLSRATMPLPGLSVGPSHLRLPASLPGLSVGPSHHDQRLWSNSGIRAAQWGG